MLLQSKNNRGLQNFQKTAPVLCKTIWKSILTFGPRVTPTASAIKSTPWSMSDFASAPNFISFGDSYLFDVLNDAPSLGAKVLVFLSRGLASD